MKIFDVKISLLTIAPMLIALIVASSISAQPAQLVLRFGFYTKDLSKSAISEMDQSLKQWVETIKKNTKVKMLANALMVNTFFESKERLVEDITDNKLDFMNLSTFDFFDLNLQNTIIPLLATSKAKEYNYERFLLIARKSSLVDEVARLSNAEIVIPNTFSASLIKIWLQTELKEKLKRAEYSKIVITESNKKENEILFSLFFNKFDFAVIKEDSYKLACEINPQMKVNTKIIAISQKYINNFFARRKDLDPEIYREIVKIGLNLDKTVEGKQILNLMQMNNMHEIYMSDLKETELLITKYKKLFPQKSSKK